MRWRFRGSARSFERMPARHRSVFLLSNPPEVDSSTHLRPENDGVRDRAIHLMREVVAMLAVLASLGLMDTFGPGGFALAWFTNLAIY
jgi:hypothetical protein